MKKTVVYGICSSTYLFLNTQNNITNNVYVTTSGDGEIEYGDVLSINELANHNISDIDKVVICSQFITDITDALIKIGIPLNKVFFFNHHTASLQACDNLKTKHVDSNKTLYAFYDLSSTVADYHVVTFALLAEIERIKQGCNHLQFIIVPNRSNKENYNGMCVFHSEEDIKWRLEHIAIPTFNSIPSCIGINQLGFREEVLMRYANEPHVFPKKYTDKSYQHSWSINDFRSILDEGFKLPHLCPQINAEKLVSNFIAYYQNKKIITITLREYDKQPDRSNNIPEWVNFLEQLDKNVFLPIIIRDTYCSAIPLPEELQQYSVFPLASINLNIRLALYKNAYINMGVSSGPLYPIHFLKGAKSIIFQFISETNPSNTLKTLKNQGTPPGKNYYFRDNRFQRIIWDVDTVENINSAFTTMVNDIESGS